MQVVLPSLLLMFEAEQAPAASPGALAAASATTTPRVEVKTQASPAESPMVESLAAANEWSAPMPDEVQAFVEEANQLERWVSTRSAPPLSRSPRKLNHLTL